MFLLKKFPGMQYLCAKLLGVFCILNAALGVSAQTDTAAAVNENDIIKISKPVPKQSIGLNGERVVKLAGQLPLLSIQQYVKGQFSGLFVQENSGEPGVGQQMYIRGLQAPLLSKKDVYAQQPVVYVDGIPLIGDNTLVYDIQQSDFNRIGPANNLLTLLDANNIQRIDVLKDAADLAKLGPVAANGAIWITTKSAKGGYNSMFAGTYFGVAANGRVTPVNALYEEQLRKGFYDRYPNEADLKSIPTYLRNSADASYFGAANWTDLYYKPEPVYSAYAGLNLSKDPRAKVNFFLHHTSNASGQDDAGFKKQGLSIFTTLLPFEWMTVKTAFNGAVVNRDRNRNFADRFAETRYIPSTNSPLSPNKNSYGNYLDIFSAPNGQPVDDNKSNFVQALAEVQARVLKKITATSRFTIDYNEGLRYAFWPTSLLEYNNFTSQYFGFNQRLQINNFITYPLKIDKNAMLNLEAGQMYQNDVQKYDYGFGYNTPNDNIKVRPLKLDYPLERPADQTFMYYFLASDKQKLTQSSVYGRVNFTYKSYLSLTAMVRRDGASYIQPDKRWMTAPSIDVNWDIKNSLLKSESVLSSFTARASYGILGIPYNTDLYSQGPMYVSTGLGLGSDPQIPSYLGSAVAGRPYSQGWVGYGIDWQKAEKASLGINAGFLQDRITVGIDVYNNNNKDMLLLLPVARETGYTGAFKNGMTVNNKGVDLDIAAAILNNARGVSWQTGVNLNINKNTLTALPDDLQSVIIGNRMLKVGESIDGFWLLQNQGIYNNVSEIPSNSGVRQGYNGIALNAGDPKWSDVNGDNIINEEDKLIKGNAMPLLFGAFHNEVSYKRYSMAFSFVFATGQKLLNQEISNRLNFPNVDGSKELSDIREIGFWKKTFDYADYPQYNPWSNVIPYQIDQDLFLQNASYLKLRSVVLSYDLIGSARMRKKFSSFSVYVSGTNLFVLSPFKNGDPELVDYRGYYTGNYQALPKLLTLGAKISLKY